MTSINPFGLSQKDLDQYRRQKCINILEKITKSCFKMFRDPATTKEQFIQRFFVLKKKLDQLEVVHLNTEYHTQMKAHIEILGNTLQGSFGFKENESSTNDQIESFTETEKQK